MDDTLPTAPPLLDLGCDYISASCSRDVPEFIETTTAWWDILHKERLDCGLIEDAGMMGYNGMISGSVFVGSRPDGMFLKVSGGAANKYLGEYLCAPGHCTRIDLQATLRYGEQWELLMNGVKNWADIANERLPPARRRKVRVVSDNEQGSTVYVGARTSPAMGRCYHKWAKDHDRYNPGDVRFEVELHKEFARDVVTQINHWQGSIDQWIKGFLWDWWKVRGIDVPLPLVVPISSRWTDVMEDTPLVQKLNWLYTQVGPTAKLLAEQGHTAEVFRVLFGPQWIEYLLGRLTEEGGVLRDKPPDAPSDDSEW